MKKSLRMKTSPETKKMTKPENLMDEYDKESLGDPAVDLEEDF